MKGKREITLNLTKSHGRKNETGHLSKNPEKCSV
jgi:hypothetical protein